MTDNIGQTNLREPEQVDWDSLGSSGYQAPPPAYDAAGQPIIYQGVVADFNEGNPDDGYLNVVLDPIKLVRAGVHEGKEVRFTYASARPFTKLGADGQRVPVKGNPNKLANYLRATGLSARPQTNAEYRAALKAAKGKAFQFVGDWEAYNKDTGERVKGYMNFPDDPERPGQKKSILKQGDVITERDAKGNITGTTTVRSEVLFANFKLRYFKDPAKPTTVKV